MQATPATADSSLLVNQPGFARLMVNGHQRNQLVDVWVCTSPLNVKLHASFLTYYNYDVIQLCAPLCLYHQMGELISEVTDLEIEQATLVIVAMSLLVSLQESVKTMGSGLEMHQLVKVSPSFLKIIHVIK